jgi:hypothetical protein
MRDRWPAICLALLALAGCALGAALEEQRATVGLHQRRLAQTKIGALRLAFTAASRPASCPRGGRARGSGVWSLMGADTIPAVADLPRAWTWSKYHSYDELGGFFAALRTAYSKHLKIYSIGKSVQGRDLWVAQLTGTGAAVPLARRRKFKVRRAGPSLAGAGPAASGHLRAPPARTGAAAASGAGRPPTPQPLLLRSTWATCMATRPPTARSCCA